MNLIANYSSPHRPSYCKAEINGMYRLWSPGL